MRRLPARLGLTGWLALAVLVLVPLLAVLQYRWLGQLSEAERERMQRTLSTAAQQLAVDVDSELGRALAGLQVDAATLERRAWDVVAQRYDAWGAAALAPDLVEGLHLAVAATDPATNATALDLLTWNVATHTFDAAPWTGVLAPLRPHLHAHVSRAAGSGERGRERIQLLWSSSTPGSERVLVSPIVRVAFPDQRPGRPTGPPDVSLLGFTILTLDVEVLSNRLLPALLHRHLYHPDGSTEYRIAVIDRDDAARVVFESQPGAAEVVLARHDASVEFLSARPGGIVLATQGLPADIVRDSSGRGPPPGGNRFIVNVRETAREMDRATTIQARWQDGHEGHWRLLVAHQAGSLDAAVAAARLRNLFLSSGILILLTVAVGLIAGSARRSQALARQQVEFVAAVTHELRTPVAVINSAAGNLADGVVGDPARVKTYGATIQAEARRLGETVERVLQLAGLEVRGGAIPREIVAPDALVRDAAAACGPEFARRDAGIDVDITPDLPAIAGDPAALRSALQNLLENAVKYGGDAPRVRVRVRTGPDSSGALPGEVRISVDDDGFGIAAEDRPHIFEPFYRGREAVRRQIQGSGLGLSLVARIARAHGGRVTLDTEPGRGSTFTLHLPASPASAPSDG